MWQKKVKHSCWFESEIQPPWQQAGLAAATPDPCALWSTAPSCARAANTCEARGKRLPCARAHGLSRRVLHSPWGCLTHRALGTGSRVPSAPGTGSTAPSAQRGRPGGDLPAGTTPVCIAPNRHRELQREWENLSHCKVTARIHPAKFCSKNEAAGTSSI